MEEPKLRRIFKVWATNLYTGVIIFSIMLSVPFLTISSVSFAFLTATEHWL